MLAVQLDRVRMQLDRVLRRCRDTEDAHGDIAEKRYALILRGR
jgi:hypothetical protein